MVPSSTYATKFSPAYSTSVSSFRRDIVTDPKLVALLDTIAAEEKKQSQRVRRRPPKLPAEITYLYATPEKPYIMVGHEGKTEVETADRLPTGTAIRTAITPVDVNLILPPPSSSTGVPSKKVPPTERKVEEDLGLPSFYKQGSKTGVYGKRYTWPLIVQKLNPTGISKYILIPVSRELNYLVSYSGELKRDRIDKIETDDIARYNFYVLSDEDKREIRIDRDFIRRMIPEPTFAYLRLNPYDFQDTIDKLFTGSPPPQNPEQLRRFDNFRNIFDYYEDQLH